MLNYSLFIFHFIGCSKFSFFLGQRIFPVGMMGKALTHIMRIE